MGASRLNLAQNGFLYARSKIPIFEKTHVLTLDLTDSHRALAPIIVTSPTARCGTTLVQRLLSSSDNAFVYGEEIGLHVRHFSDWLLENMMHLEQNGDRFDLEFQRTLHGEQNDWRPGLPPPPHVLLPAYLETFFQVPMALQTYSASIGRPLWGFKCPGLTSNAIRFLLTLMPRATVIYVVRDLVDALKSAKARKFVNGDADLVNFCTAWRDNLSGVLEQAEGQRILLVRYDDLCAQPDAGVARLEAFTRAAAISTRDFSNKINTFIGDPAEGRSPTQYIDPAELSAEEEFVVSAYAQPVQALLSNLRFAA
jgi:hypothetical protein